MKEFLFYYIDKIKSLFVDKKECCECCDKEVEIKEILVPKKAYTYTIWTADEVAFIRDCAKNNIDLTSVIIALAPRTEKSIRSKINKLGYCVKRGIIYCNKI